MTSIVFRQKKGLHWTEKPWGGDSFSSAVLVEQEKNGGKFSKSGEEQTDENGKHVLK